MSQEITKQPTLPGFEGTKPETDKVKDEQKKVKKHPILGEYIEVIVIPLMELDMKGTGFVSIGAYTAEYQYNKKHSFPIKVVEFIESLQETKRSYKETYDEETGPSKEIIINKTPRFNVIRTQG